MLYLWNDSQSSPINLLIDLEGYELGLKHSGSLKSNLEVLFNVTVYNNANLNLAPYTLDVHQKISNVSFKKFSGFIGSIPIPFAPTSISLDMLKNRLSGNIDFQNPEISFTAANSIGAPLQVQFVNIRSVFIGSPELNKSLSGDYESQAWIVNSPANGQMMKSASSSFKITKDNSNIREILYEMPDRLSFAAKVNTNPNGNTASNFFYNESHVAIAMDIELPMHGIADNLVLQDKYQFDFDDMESLKSAEFKLNLINNFPVNSTLQVYFADADLMIIDSLFSSPVFVETGDTDPATMKVISPAHITTTNSFDENRFGRIKYETKYILVHSMLDTPDNTVTKIFADNYLDVQIGALYTKY
jgi:hypothetical protein